MDQINRTLQKFKIVIFFYYEIVIISKRELKKSYLSWQAKSSASLQARWELKIQSYGSHCPQESTQQDRGITLLFASRTDKTRKPGVLQLVGRCMEGIFLSQNEDVLVVNHTECSPLRGKPAKTWTRIRLQLHKMPRKGNKRAYFLQMPVCERGMETNTTG